MVIRFICSFVAFAFICISPSVSGVNPCPWTLTYVEYKVYQIIGHRGELVQRCEYRFQMIADIRLNPRLSLVVTRETFMEGALTK